MNGTWKTRRVKFVNFFPFFVRGGVKVLDIELPRDMNTFVVLGDNGMGKSTLTKNLNPLPRYDMSDLIIEKAEGLKEVHLENEMSTFDLKCMIRYVPVTSKGKHSHSIKAHLFKINKETKKVTELNENGNVTSYIELIEGYMDLSKDLRRLLVISQDDIGIIGETTSNRRQLMKGFTPAIDSLDKVSKGLTEEHTLVKRDLVASETKISRYPDKENLKVILLEKSNYMTKLEKDLLDITENYGRMSGLSDRVATLRLNVTNYENEIKDIDTCIDVCDKDSSVSEMFDIASRKRDDVSETLSDAKNKRNNIVNSISKIKQNAKRMDVNRLKVEVTELEGRLQDSKVDTNEIPCVSIDALDELSKGIAVLEKGRKIIELGMGGMGIDVFNDLHDTDMKIICDTLKANKVKLESNDVRREEISSVFHDVKIDEVTAEMEIPSKCDFNECVARKMFEEYKEQALMYKRYGGELNDIMVDNNKMLQYNHDATTYIEVLTDCERAIVELEVYACTLESLTGKKFSDIATIENIVIENKFKANIGGLVSDIEFIKRQLTVRRDVERLNELKAMIDVSSDIDSTAIKSMEHEVATLNVDIEKLEMVYSDSDKVFKKLINFNGSPLFNIQYEDLVDISKSKKRELVESNIELKEKEQLVMNFDKVKDTKVDIDSEIKELRAEITEVGTKVKLVEMLEDELKNLKVKERESSILRNTGSVRLPVRIMKDFLNEIKVVANEFLALTDMPYRFNKLSVSETDFVIEVLNGVHIIKDISLLSSGEKYLMGVLLNFAIQNRSLGSYRDIILDEVDSPLKSTNRDKLFKMLLRRNEVMVTGNTFIISHNTEIHKYTKDGAGYIVFKGADNVPSDVNVIWENK